MVQFLLGWGIFVALVYLLMYVDYFTHKHNIAEAFRAFADSFGEE